MRPVRLHLATSRESLQAADEFVFELAPLEIPPEGAPSAEALRAAVDEESTVDVLNQQPLYRPTVSSHKPEQRRGSRP